MSEESMNKKVESGEQDPDSALVERLKKGEAAAMEELVNKYQQWVYTLAYRTLRNPDAADDVTQETFIRAYRSIQSYYPQRGHRFSGWLYRITVNLSLNQLKKQKKDKFRFWSHKTEPEKEKQAPAQVETLPSPDPSPADAARTNEFKDKLESALGKLSAEHRLVFTLCEIHGHSYREAAEIMECPLGTVMSRLYYAKKVLKEELKPYYGKS
jgi:RNA polymerase sigma-70 factor (ECF subfamily)